MMKKFGKVMKPVVVFLVLISLSYLPLVDAGYRDAGVPPYLPVYLDTNASTACDGAEVLLGNSSCENSTAYLIDLNDFAFNSSYFLKSDFYDTNISTTYNATYETNISLLFTNWQAMYNSSYESTYNQSYESTYNATYDGLIGGSGDGSYNATYLRRDGDEGQSLNITENFNAETYRSTGSWISFNFIDDGSELYWNATAVPDVVGIETENSKIKLYNEPNGANDFKVFQIFSKEGSDQTEFVVTKAGVGHHAYFSRSLGVGSPNFNCTTFANFIDCNTGLTGADLWVMDEIEVNNSIYVGQGDFRVDKFGNIIANGNLTLSNLTSCDTIDTDATGKLVCGTDATGAGGGNPFDQDLNTTDGVQFRNLSLIADLSDVNKGTFIKMQSASAGFSWIQFGDDIDADEARIIYSPASQSIQVNLTGGNDKRFEITTHTSETSGSQASFILNRESSGTPSADFAVGIRGQVDGTNLADIYFQRENTASIGGIEVNIQTAGGAERLLQISGQYRGTCVGDDTGSLDCSDAVFTATYNNQTTGKEAVALSHQDNAGGKIATHQFEQDDVDAQFLNYVGTKGTKCGDHILDTVGIGYLFDISNPTGWVLVNVTGYTNTYYYMPIVQCTAL